MAKSAPLSNRSKGARNAADSMKDDYPEPYPGSPAFGARAASRKGKLKSREGRDLRVKTAYATAKSKRDETNDMLKKAY